MKVSFPLTHRRRAAFTLVEVCMAIGIVAFAFVGIFALLPAGLSLFRQAMDTSIGAQVAQRVVGEAEQTDFDALVNSTDPGVKRNENFYLFPDRSFDDQGIEIPATAPAADQRRILYSVRMRGSVPGNLDASTASPSNFTSLPSTEGTRYNPRSITFLTVQVVKNPGHKDLGKVMDSETFLITPAAAKSNYLALQTYSAVVARNGFRMQK